MNNARSSGILLHPTSLPGEHGIGDLGEGAFRFVDFLQEAKQSRWQVLPLGPTGFGDSPYSSFSSFAGNPLLISMDRVVADGFLESAEIVPSGFADPCRVDFGRVIGWKLPLLERAAVRFLETANRSLRKQLDDFCEKQSAWLDDYSLFMAIKDRFDARASHDGTSGGMWCNSWDRDIAGREPAAVARWKKDCRRQIQIRQVMQFWFFGQWHRLKRYANERSLRIIGDLPYVVSLDSADVWSSPQSFLLNDDGSPIVVAGVPPDYFATTGQRWGNPLYDWEQMEGDGFQWWIRRIRKTCDLFDLVRLDHFRGFEACWSIPAGEPTAEHGEWVSVPGRKLFQKMREELGYLPLIAEDLGLITPEVDALREDFELPGMRVLQFAFDTREERSKIYLPHNYDSNSVVYTGTHDNDTVCGWYDNCNDDEREAVAKYIGHPLIEVEWEFIRLALASVAGTAIVPMQDLLGLGSESRMNIPATSGNNWAWRMPFDYRDSGIAERLAGLTFVYGREPGG